MDGKLRRIDRLSHDAAPLYVIIERQGSGTRRVTRLGLPGASVAYTACDEAEKQSKRHGVEGSWGSLRERGKTIFRHGLR